MLLHTIISDIVGNVLVKTLQNPPLLKSVQNSYTSHPLTQLYFSDYCSDSCSRIVAPSWLCQLNLK